MIQTSSQPRGFFPEINFDRTPEEFRRFRKLLIPAKSVLLLDYAREALQTTAQRGTLMRRKNFNGLYGCESVIVGFICIGRASNHTFRHLVWYLKSHDRPLDPTGPYALPPEKQKDPKFRHVGPCEGVEPARILEFFPEIMGWSI